MTPDEAHAQVRRIADYFETLSVERLDELGNYYAPDAHFRDPFQDVHGIPAIAGVLRHMYATLDEPRFVVQSSVVEKGPDGVRAFLVWDFLFRFRSPPRAQQSLRGGTHLLLAPDGRVRLHHDYWDAAQGIYEKLPIIGALLRWLRQRVARS